MDGLANRLGYKGRNRGSFARTHNAMLDSLQIISTVHPYLTRSLHLGSGLNHSFGVGAGLPSGLISLMDGLCEERQENKRSEHGDDE
jgi:hypothetical protein